MSHSALGITNPAYTDEEMYVFCAQKVPGYLCVSRFLTLSCCLRTILLEGLQSTILKVLS